MGPSLRQRARITKEILRWASAIKHASDEHGRPNSFGVVELATEYGLKKRDGYFFGSKLGLSYMPELWQALGGHDGWGSMLTYANGRYYV